MKYTSPPDHTSSKQHQKYWEEAEDFAQEGLVWCQANFCCDTVCFCQALAASWQSLTTAGFPDRLLKHRKALSSININRQANAVLNPAQSNCSQTGQSKENTYSTQTPQSSAAHIAQRTASQHLASVESSPSANASASRTFTPSVLQTLAGGFTGPIRDMHSPLQISFDSEATISDAAGEVS